MSSKLLDFKASEKSGRVHVDTKIGGNSDLELGTSGSYKTFDADVQQRDATSEQTTSDSQPTGLGSASVTMDEGISSSMGGVGKTRGDFQSVANRGSRGKGEKHERDSSSDSSSSSSSSDETDKESAKAKRRKKKKRKGILSGSFLPKFGASKKSTSSKDDSNRPRAVAGEVALGLKTSENVRDRPRPPSAEVQIQAAFDSDTQDNTRSQDDGPRPDVEDFSGIGADGQNTGQSREEETLQEISKDDLGQGAQETAPGSHDPLEVTVACGAAWLPETSTLPIVRVTVTSSSVDKFPAPELRSVDDGTDVDLGLATQLGGEYYDPNIETMDTTDLLSQIENTINSIEAAQQQDAGTLESDLEVNGNPTLSVSVNTNPHSVNIPAVDDLDTSTHHRHLPEPKDGPILELPEGAQVLAGSNLSKAEADRSVLDASLQIGSEKRSGSPSFLSQSTMIEKEAKPKDISPSLQFHMPKGGVQGSPGIKGDLGSVSIDAAAEKDNDGNVPSQPDLVLAVSDNDTSRKDVHLEEGISVSADFAPNSVRLNKEEPERDDSSDIDAYLGEAAVVTLSSVDGENGEVNVSLHGNAKAISKGKSKKGKFKMPRFKKFGSKKSEGDLDVPKVSAVRDMNLEKPDADGDIDVDISVSDGHSRPAFEVVGKRASLKRDVGDPIVEMPVSEEVQLVVETEPPGGDFEVSLPEFGGGDNNAGVGFSSPDGKQQNGVKDSFDGMDASLDTKFGVISSGGIPLDAPERNGLNVGGGLDMEDTSDIETYFDSSKVGASPAAGSIDANVSMRSPDTSGVVKVSYNKGKTSRKGNRNTPKFKSKPNYGVKAGQVDVQSPNVIVSLDIGVEKSWPSGDFEVEVQSPEAEGFLQTPKAEVKASVSEPNLVYDGEVKRKGFTLPRLRVPKLKKKSRKSSKDKRASGSFDAEMGAALPSGSKIGASASMPDISYTAKGQADTDGQANPKFEGPSSLSSPNMDSDERKKKRWSGGFKFPSFGLPKFGGRKKSHSSSEGHDISAEVDVSIDKPQKGGIGNSRDESIHVDGNLDNFPEVDIETKSQQKNENLDNRFSLSSDFDRNFGADIDKPRDKAGTGVDIDTDVPKIEGDIEFTAIEGQSSSLPVPYHDADVDLSLNSAINPSAILPSIEMEGLKGAGDFDVNMRESAVNVQSDSGDIVGSNIMPSSEFDVDIPKGKINFNGGDKDVEISGNIDGDIDVQLGDFGIGSDIHTSRGDVENPSGEIGLDAAVGGNVGQPELGMKVKGDGDDKSVTSSSSSSSSSDNDKKNKRKGFFGSLHLPKFGGKGRMKKPKGLEIDMEEGGDIAFEVHKPTGTVGVDDRDIVVGAETITPEVGVTQREMKPDFDVNISKPDVELPDVTGNIDGIMDLPSGSIVVDVPGGNIDVDTEDQDIDISGNVDISNDVPKGDFSTGGDLPTTRGEFETPRGEASVGVSVGVGGSFDMPEVVMKVKGDEDNKSIASSSSSSSSEGSGKKRKGLFGSLHLPKFGGKGRSKKSIGTGMSFDQGDDVEVDLDRPQVNVEMDQGDINIGAGVVLPEVSVSQKEMKPDFDVDISQPELPNVSSNVDSSVHLPSCDIEVSIPTGKPDGQAGGLDVEVSGNGDGDLDVPEGGFGTGGEVHAPRGDVEAPRGEIGVEVGVGGNVGLPEVGTKVKRDGDDISVTSSSSSSSSGNDNKKKKKGFFGSLHLPKFRGKGHVRKPKGPKIDMKEGNDIAFKVDKPTGTVGEYDRDIGAGTQKIIPEVGVSQREVKPDFDVNISKPDVEQPDVAGSIDGRVDLPSGNIEVDIPEENIDVDIEDQNLDVSGNVDVSIDIPKGDFGIGGNLLTSRDEFETPRGDAGVIVGVEGSFDMPEVGMKVGGDEDNKSITSSSSSSGSERGGKKRKGLFGSLHLPKFGGKGRSKKSIGAGVSFERGDHVGVDLDRPPGSVDMNQGHIGEGIVMPEVSVSQKEMKPDFDEDISQPDLPDVSSNVDSNVSLPSGDIDVNIPTKKIDGKRGDRDVEISGNVDDDTDVPQGKFAIAGSIHAPRVDVEAPSGETGLDVGVGGNVCLPEVGMKVKGDGDDRSITSSSSSHSSENDNKKRRGIFGSLHLPKFGGKGHMKKPKGPEIDMEEGVDIAFKVDKPTGTVPVDERDIEVEAETVTPEVGVSQREMKPDFDVNISKPDVELPDVTGNIDGRVDLRSGNTKIGIPKENIDVDNEDQNFNISGNVDVSIDIPKGDFDVVSDLPTTRGEFETPRDVVGVNVGVGGSFDIPEVGVKVTVDGDNTSIASSLSSSGLEGAEKKKKGLFGSLHLPKFGGKGRSKKSIGTGVSFDKGDDLEVDLNTPKVSVDIDQGDINIGPVVVMPEVSVRQKEMKPDFEGGITKPDLPEVSSNVNSSVSLPSGDTEVNFPIGKIDGKVVDQDVEISMNVDGDIDVPQGDIGIGGDVHIPRGDMEAPSGEIGRDVGGKVELPEVRIKLKGDGDDKSITSSSSSSSSGSDKKKTKKGFFGSFHLPKFGGKGHMKKAKGPEIDIEEGDGIAFKVDKPTGTVAVDDRDVEAGAGIITPEVSVSQEEMKHDFDVNISKPDFELPDIEQPDETFNIDQKMNLPSGNIEEDIPGENIDIDTADHNVGISGSVDVNTDVPKGDFDIGGDRPTTTGCLETTKGAAGVNIGVVGSFDMPEVGIKVKGDGDNKSITSSPSSGGSEGGGKKKKGLFGSLHLPKFRGKGQLQKSIGTGVSFDEGDDGELHLDGPKFSVELDQGGIDVGAEEVMPEVSVIQKDVKPDFDVDISQPELPDVSSNVDGSVHLPSGDMEVNIPTGKVGVDRNHQGVEISGTIDGGIDGSQLRLGIGGDTHDPRVDAESPSGELGLDVGVGRNIGMPEVGVKVKGDGDNKSVTSSSSSSSSEGDEKKKKGFFGSLHLPKFGGKGRSKKPKGLGLDMKEGSNIAFKVDKPTGTVGVDDRGIHVGAESLTPEVGVHQREMKPDFDVNISKPDVELPPVAGSIDEGVDLPSGNTEVEIPKEHIDLDTEDQSMDISGNVDVSIGVPKGDFDVERELPTTRGEFETPRGEAGVNVGVVGSFDMPEVEMKVKGDEDNKSITSSSSSSGSEGGGKKKKGLFGSLHLPKFGDKGRSKKAIGAGVKFDQVDDVEVDLNRPQVSADMNQGDINIGAGVVLPEVSVSQKEMKPDFDVDILQPDLPVVSGNVDGSVSLPSGDAEVSIPTGKVGVDRGHQGVEISGTFDGDIDVPQGGLVTGGDIHDPRVDVESPSGEIGLDVGVGKNVGMPEIGIKVKGDGDDKSVTSSSSSSGSEVDEKKKKGFFWSLHLPKFGGKGRSKKPKGPGLEMEEENDTAFKVDKPTGTVGVDDRGIHVGTESITPDVDVHQREMKPDFDVNISKPNVELPDVAGSIDGRVDLPSGNTELETSKDHIDLDTEDQRMDISGNVDVSIDVPKGDFGIGGELPTTRGEFETPRREAGVNVGVVGSFDVPEVEMKLKGDEDNKSITSSSSSSSSEVGKKKKKGLFGSLHLPKFGGEGQSKKSIVAGVNFDQDDHVGVDLGRPQLSVEMDKGDIDIGPEEVIPEVSVSQKDAKPDFDVNFPQPDVPNVSGNVDSSVSLPSGGIEVNISTGKLDLGKGDQDMDISGSVDEDIDVPQGDLGIGGEIHVPRGNVDAPSGEIFLDVAVGGNVDMPEDGIKVKGDEDDKRVTSSPSSSSLEEEKKEKRGLFGGLHLPKLGFPKRTKRASGSLDQADVNIDDNVDVSADPSLIDINPEVSFEVQANKGEVDVHQREVGGAIGNLDVQIAAGLPSGRTISDLNIDSAVPDVDQTIVGTSSLSGLKWEGDFSVPQKTVVDVGDPEVNLKESSKISSIDQPSIDVDVDTVEIGSDVPGDMDVDVKLPAAIKGPDVSLKEDEKTDVRAGSTSSSSSDEDEERTATKKKKKGFLPFHLPKIQLKRPKSPEKKKGLSPANVEVELKTDVDVPDTNVSGALTTGVDISDHSLDSDQPNVEVSGPEREIDVGPEVEEPEMAVSVVSSVKPKLDLSFLDGVNEPESETNENAYAEIGTDVDVGLEGNAEAGVKQNVVVPEFGVGIHRPRSANVSDDDINFETFGKLLGEASLGDVDMGDSLKVNIGQGDEDLTEVESEVPAFQVQNDLNAGFDLSKQLGTELEADQGGDTHLSPGDLNAGISLSRSSSKSSVTSSSSTSSAEEVKPKKSKGFLPSLKFPKLTSGKGMGKEESPRLDGRGDTSVEVEENIAPSLTVDVESVPPLAPSKVETKSPKGKLGLFKKGKAKKADSPRSLKSDFEVQADPGADNIIPSVNASLESSPPKGRIKLEIPSSSPTPGNLDLSGAIAAHSMPTTPQPTSPSTPHSFSVVVAIDFGTTFSGYAYSFTKEPDDVHVMRKWEGGDPGVINMKTLTTLLLTPEGEFHSFGFSARDFYHDMNFTEAQKWLYFDKYKLTLHDDQKLNIETELIASNGTRVKALTVFTHTLKFFKDHFLEELMDLSMDDGPVDEGEIRWVLTVPAIWRQPAKQFMRQAAYQAGIASPLMPNQLLIALEPEAASIYIGKLSMKQLMPERMALKRERWLRGSMGKGNNPDMKVIEELKQGSRYVVVDCGGGTVDITVHEWEQDSGTLKELHKASGGTFGSINVDEAFVDLLVDIFGNDFIEEFKIKRPAGWVDLLLAFEARKRNANPWKANYLNVSLPFSFIDYYKKFTNGNLTVDKTLLEYNSQDVSWCGEAPGMLRFSQEGMFKLFRPTTDRLIAKVDQVLEKPELGGISHLFLAGGFAESPLLQHQIREKYKDSLRVVIPQDVGLATLKGAVMYGQNPKAVSVRRTRLTYGVGALNKFNPQIHPEDKKIVKDGKEWCKDVFDVFVYADQSVTGGDIVTRSYAPASTEQDAIKINIYCTEKEDCLFITDEQVRKCGTLTIDLRGSYKGPKRRELQLSMQFGDTEVKVDALDVATGKKVEARVDFLNN